AWRAAFTRFACMEQEKPVAFEDGAVVFEGERYVISDHDLAEACVVRLPEDHPLPAKVRKALRSAA
ncbi:MAG TPA: hypothetical protein VLI04_04140, partial [Nocardioidaceae bacterium]|nr:hypothetical protein [Nocardioidaceae bacterium]